MIYEADEDSMDSFGFWGVWGFRVLIFTGLTDSLVFFFWEGGGGLGL